MSIKENLEYKEIFIENCMYDEPINYKCNADAIKLAVIDSEGNQKYVGILETINEELAVQRIHNEIVEKGIEEGEFEWNNNTYNWYISIYN